MFFEFFCMPFNWKLSTVQYLTIWIHITRYKLYFAGFLGVYSSSFFFKCMKDNKIIGFYFVFVFISIQLLALLGTIPFWSPMQLLCGYRRLRSWDAFLAGICISSRGPFTVFHKEKGEISRYLELTHLWKREVFWAYYIRLLLFVTWALYG